MEPSVDMCTDMHLKPYIITGMGRHTLATHPIIVVVGAILENSDMQSMLRQ